MSFLHKVVKIEHQMSSCECRHDTVSTNGKSNSTNETEVAKGLLRLIKVSGGAFSTYWSARYLGPPSEGGCRMVGSMHAL